jgi:hypothetical protein
MHYMLNTRSGTLSFRWKICVRFLIYLTYTEWATGTTETYTSIDIEHASGGMHYGRDSAR